MIFLYTVNTHSSHWLIIENGLTNSQADEVRQKKLRTQMRRGRVKGEASQPLRNEKYQSTGKPREMWQNIDNRNGLG